MGESKGEARYVQRGGKMMEATDDMGALFDMTEALELSLVMGNSEPDKEMKRLLHRKVKILTEMRDILNASQS